MIGNNSHLPRKERQFRSGNMVWGEVLEHDKVSYQEKGTRTQSATEKLCILYKN